MPRKCKHKRFRFDEQGDDSEVGAQFKIGSKNVQRWMKIKQTTGFNSDIEFAEYLLNLAEGTRPSNNVMLNTIQPFSPPPPEQTFPLSEEIPASDGVAVDAVDADSSKCEPFISLLMECDEH